MYNCVLVSIPNIGVLGQIRAFSGIVVVCRQIQWDNINGVNDYLKCSLNLW